MELNNNQLVKKHKLMKENYSFALIKKLIHFIMGFKNTHLIRSELSSVGIHHGIHYKTVYVLSLSAYFLQNHNVLSIDYTNTA